MSQCPHTPPYLIAHGPLKVTVPPPAPLPPTAFAPAIVTTPVQAAKAMVKAAATTSTVAATIAQAQQPKSLAASKVGTPASSPVTYNGHTLAELKMMVTRNVWTAITGAGVVHIIPRTGDPTLIAQVPLAIWQAS